MKGLFSFFLRLFFAFVAAKFLLRVLAVEGRGYLLGLTLLFVANVYWFDFLEYRARRFHRPQEPRGPEAREGPTVPPG